MSPLHVILTTLFLWSYQADTVFVFVVVVLFVCCVSQLLGDLRPNEVKHLPGTGLPVLGVEARRCIHTLKDDASAESSGMSGSVTWTAFLGKEQDVHMHGGVRGLEKAEGGSHRYLSLLS